jgi:phospholipase/carboxylesterase
VRLAAIIIILCATCAAANPARLTIRPAKPTAPCVPGLHPLGLASGHDGLLLIPASAASAKRHHLVVFLHGANHDVQQMLDAMRSEAESQGFLLLVPESRGMTWDAIRGTFGPDVEFLNHALESVFRQCAVDSGHITLAGFSDGASYALSLGLANGDLFTRIMAFSPGFIVPAERSGKPQIFITHGTHDRILPIDQTSRRIVPELQDAGYFVTYREFDGPHAMSRELIAQAVKWAR